MSDNESLPSPQRPQRRQNAQRNRSMLSPLDETLQNTRQFSMVREVKLDDLMDEKKVLEMNMNRQYIDAQLLRIITPNKDQKASIYFRRQNQKNNSEVHFSRMYLCRVYSSDIDHNCLMFYLMEANMCNNSLFDRNLEYRDNGVFTIGSYFRVLAPLAVESFMNGDIPMVKTQNPIIVMKHPDHVNAVMINTQITGNNTRAFVYNNVTLKINRTAALETTCSGFLCDKQRCGDWCGKQGCGCYHMTQYRSNLVMQHGIYFETEAAKVIHRDFSSTKFSLLYLKDHFPGAIRVSSLRGTDAYWDIEEAVNNMVEYVNNNGGWTAVGWYKRGMINKF